MKKTLAILLVLCLALGMLSACGSRTATDGDAFTTDGNAFATDGDAFATDGDAVSPDGIPVDPQETGAPTPEPPVETEQNTGAALSGDGELSALLLAIRDEYQPGTAGGSLTAIRLAGQIMDWYGSAGSINAAYEAASALGDPGADVAGNAYLDKLESVYAAAVGLYGYYGESSLRDAGYTPQSWPYAMSDVKEVFDGIFSGFGQGAGAPVYARVFRSDDNAERFVAFAVKIDDLAPENLVSALVQSGVLAEDVAVNSVNFTENGMELDLNAAFRTQLQGQGSTGEYMLLGALVNTFLENYSADSITITVDGGMLESGHAVYDQPLTMYEDNVAVG